MILAAIGSGWERSGPRRDWGNPRSRAVLREWMGRPVKPDGVPRGRNEVDPVDGRKRRALCRRPADGWNPAALGIDPAATIRAASSGRDETGSPARKNRMAPREERKLDPPG